MWIIHTQTIVFVYLQMQLTRGNNNMLASFLDKNLYIGIRLL